MNTVKYILNSLFRPTKITKEYMQSLHVRDILFVQVPIFAVLLTIYLIMKISIPSYLIAGTVIVVFLIVIAVCLLDAAILYAFDRILIKKILDFRMCIKIRTPIITVDIMRMIIGILLFLFEIKVSGTVKGVYLLLDIAAFCPVVYYLRKFYNYSIKNIIGIVLVYVVIYAV